MLSSRQLNAFTVADMAYWQRTRWIKYVGSGLAGVALSALAGGLVWHGDVQAQDGGTLVLRSDVQEANAQTGIITARGNVQIDYPARQIYATSAQAQYFSNERRIILSGNVVVTQEGNRLTAETITYLIDEGRFVALPQPNQQVEAIYLVPESTPAPAPEPTPGPAPTPDPPASLDIDSLESAPDEDPQTAPLN